MSEQQNRIEIRQMRRGFTVLGVPGKQGDRYVGLAGCSSFEDLIDWLAAHFGASISEDYYRRKVEEVDAHRRAKSVNLENLFAAKERRSDRVEKPDDFDWHRVTDEPAPEGEAIGYPPSPEASIDELRAELEGKMGEARRAEPAEPAAPGTSPMAPVAEAADQSEHDSEDGDDAPEPERDRIIAALTPNQAKVFDFLQLTQMGHEGWFAMTRTAIGIAAGLRADTVPPVIGALEERKLIAVKRQGKGKPVLYRVDVPEDGDDGDA